MTVMLKTDDNVWVVGGKYKGRYGVVVRVTAKMVVVRLAGMLEDVRVCQYHVEKKQLGDKGLNMVDCVAGKKDPLVVARLKVELELLKEKVDELTLLLDEMEMH